jgi:hypothetical protein
MNHRHTALAVIVIAAWITGCAPTTEEIPTGEQAALQQALELDNGGFTTDDAEPYFGMEEEFVDTGLDMEDPAIDDPMLIHGPDGIPYEGDDANAITVLILWGQLRVNPDMELPRMWDGEISATTGGLIARRAVRFEGPTDELMPRPDVRTVPFRSATMPHNDGLLVTLVLPPEGVPAPAVLPELVVNLNGVDEIRIEASDLADGYRTGMLVDDLGNMVVITTVPNHPCPHGMLAGVWRSVIPGRLGTFHGRWVGMLGELHGHLRGIYGVNGEGRRVFFGKYIGNEGEFRGFLRGVYGDGGFTGHWVNRGGELTGGLAGHYVELDSRLPGDGVFAGGWVEACDRDECRADGSCPGVDPSIEGADDLPIE